jgi:hypothetical protein
VHLHLLAGCRLDTVTDDEILGEEVEGNVALRLVDLGPLECQPARTLLRVHRMAVRVVLLAHRMAVVGMRMPGQPPAAIDVAIVTS